MSAETDAGLAALQSGDINGAIAQLERAIANDPNDYQAHQYLGAAYGQGGRQMDAVTTLTQAVTLQPSNAQARYNLAVAYESAGYKEQALVAAQQALQLQADYPKRRKRSRVSPERLRLPPTLRPWRRRSMDSKTSPQRTASRPTAAATATVWSAYRAAAVWSTATGALWPAAPTASLRPTATAAALWTTAATALSAAGSRRLCGAPRNVYTPPNAMPMIAQDCKEANDALILSIVSLFCCGIILAPMALVKANSKRMIAENPGMNGAGKAQTATVIAIIALVLWALSLVFRLANLGSAISGSMPH